MTSSKWSGIVIFKEDAKLEASAEKNEANLEEVLHVIASLS
jgi:hypothetical protein